MTLDPGLPLLMCSLINSTTPKATNSSIDIVHRSVQCMSNFYVPVPADFTKAKGTWMMEKNNILSRLRNCTSLSCSGPELGSEFLQRHNCPGRTPWGSCTCTTPHDVMPMSVTDQPCLARKVCPVNRVCQATSHRALGTAAWTPEQHWEAPVAGQIEHVESLCSWSKAYCFTLGFSWCWQLLHNCGVHHWQRLSQVAGSSLFCLSSSSSSSSSAAAAGQAKPHHLSTHVQ